MDLPAAFRRSLSLQVAVGIGLIAVLVLGALTALQHSEISTRLEAVRQAEEQRFATTLANGVASLFDADPSLPPAPRATLERLIGSAVHDSALADIAVVDIHGAVLARANPAQPTPAAMSVAIARAFAREQPVIDRMGEDLAFVIPIRGRPASPDRPGRPVAAVYVRPVPISIATVVSRMVLRLGVLAGGIALAGVALALALLSRIVLRPTRTLAAQAERLAAGDLGARSGVAPRAPGNELVRLGQALDAMAEQIAEDVRRLQRSEERHREVVESAVDGIFTADATGTVLDVNPSVQTLVGRPREQVIGRPLGEFVHPEEGPALASIIAHLMAGEVVVREWRMRLRNDTYLPIEVSATRLPDGRLQGITRDITRRKRSEEELRRLILQQKSVATLGQHALARVEGSRLMDEAVALVADGLGTPYCKVLELLPDGSALRLRAAVGWSSELIGRVQVSTGRESQAGFTLLSDGAVVVEDLRTESRFSEPLPGADAPLVSGLSVVVRSGGTPFGVLAVHATERRHFTPDDVHFAEAVANVLAQAIARTETEEALRVSERRYRLAARATRDAMYDWDIAGDRTFWSEGIKLLFGHSPGAVGSGLEWWMKYIHPDDREGMLRSVSDTLSAGLRAWRAEYRFRRADGSYAQVQDRGYIEYDTRGTPLRAVGAMTDVTEQKRAEQALERQAGFVKLSRAVAVTANEAVDVAEAVGDILRLVCEHNGWPVGRAVILSFDDRVTPQPSLWYLADLERFAEFRAVSEATAVQRGVGTIGQAWETAQPAWIAYEGTPLPRRAAAIASGLGSGMAFPVLVGTAVVGILEFLAEERTPPADDLVTVMAGIGTQIGRVIERAQSEERLRDYTERLETLSRRLIAAQETERRHVARELHDEIGQALTALKLNLQALVRGGEPDPVRTMLEESLLLADHTLQQTRDLSLDLRPALLDDLGLVPALRWYLDRQGRRAGFVTEFAAVEVGDAVPSEVATTCFRIAQEALTNVVRHAHATKVTLALTRRDTELELEVRDSGRGFDRERATARAVAGGSLGLLSMRERAALVGGTLTIDSVVGRGTVVRVRLPLPADLPVGYERASY